jgi:hypothetical protein
VRLGHYDILSPAEEGKIARLGGKDERLDRTVVKVTAGRKVKLLDSRRFSPSTMNPSEIVAISSAE